MLRKLAQLRRRALGQVKSGQAGGAGDAIAKKRFIQYARNLQKGEDEGGLGMDPQQAIRKTYENYRRMPGTPAMGRLVKQIGRGAGLDRLSTVRGRNALGSISTEGAEYRARWLRELEANSVEEVRQKLSNGKITPEQLQQAESSARKHVETFYGEGTNTQSLRPELQDPNARRAIGEFQSRIQGGQQVEAARAAVNDKYDVRIPRSVVNEGYASTEPTKKLVPWRTVTDEPEKLERWWRSNNPYASIEEEAQWRQDNLSRGYRQQNPIYQGGLDLQGKLPARRQVAQPPETPVARAPAPSAPAQSAAPTQAAAPVSEGRVNAQKVRQAYTSAAQNLQQTHGEEAWNKMPKSQQNRLIAAEMTRGDDVDPAVQSYVKGQMSPGERLYEWTGGKREVDPETGKLRGTMMDVQEGMQDTLGKNDKVIALEKERDEAIAKERTRRNEKQKRILDALGDLRAGEIGRGKFNAIRSQEFVGESALRREHATNIMELNEDIRQHQATGQATGYAPAQGQSGIQLSEMGNGEYGFAYTDPTSGSLQTGTVAADSFDDARRMAGEIYNRQLEGFRKPPTYDLSQARSQQAAGKAEGQAEGAGQTGAPGGKPTGISWKMEGGGTALQEYRRQIKEHWKAKRPDIYDRWQKGKLSAEDYRKAQSEIDAQKRNDWWRTAANIDYMNPRNQDAPEAHYSVPNRRWQSAPPTLWGRVAGKLNSIPSGAAQAAGELADIKEQTGDFIGQTARKGWDWVTGR